MYIQVEPIIQVGGSTAANPTQQISLNSIRCQTVLTKCLGPLSTWESKLLVAKNTGYNVVHFTPIQELGGSRSAYSIREQQKVNVDFAEAGSKKAPSFDDVEKVLRKLRTDWGLASICDIVLNHTANESQWIYDNPEAAYSAATTPHLRPAILLDAMFAKISADVAAGQLAGVGVPEVPEHEDHLQALKYQMHTVYLPMLKIYEFFQINISRYVERFNESIRTEAPSQRRDGNDNPSEIYIVQDPEYRRLGSTIDYDAAQLRFNTFRPDCFDEDTRVRRCCESFRKYLERLNDQKFLELQEYMSCAVENCLAGMRYERIQDDGPKVRVISIQYPLFTPYFTDGGLKGAPLKQIETAMFGAQGRHMMAHNGWVMSADPLTDFARPQQGIANVYLKRELIAWGDSVKLR